MVNFILFGATGDLSRLKILPALLRLQAEQTTGHQFKLIAVGRRTHNLKSLQQELANVPLNPFTKDLSILDPIYIKLDVANPDSYGELATYLSNTTEQILIFMAIPPNGVSQFALGLKDTALQKLLRERPAKVVVEKPFGDSLSSARALNRELAKTFSADCILRNDHYLQKITIAQLCQLALTTDIQTELSTGNITAIKLVASDPLPLTGRASYFEGRGILVDWMQSHLLQILAEFASTALKVEKSKFLDSLYPVANSLIRGQCESYRELADVGAGSTTETFFAFKVLTRLMPKTEIALIAGKGLATKEVFLELTFGTGKTVSFPIQAPKNNDSREYREDGRDYDRVILSALQTEPSRFVSFAEITAQWKLIDAVKQIRSQVPLESYPTGTSYQHFCSGKWCAN